MICQSWERAQETERLGKWLKGKYVRIEPVMEKKLKETKLPIYHGSLQASLARFEDAPEGRPSRWCGLSKEVPSGVSRSSSPVCAAFACAL